MQRRAPLVFVTLAVVATVVASAVVFLGPPRVQLVDQPTAADKVTLYQSGLAFVELSRTFTSGGGETILDFVLPRTAVADSLVIEGAGVVVKEVRSSLPDAGLLHPGDTIVVHVEGGTSYRGTLVSMDGGRLVLATESGSTLIEMGKVLVIEVPDRKVEGRDPTAADLSVLVEAPAGTPSIRLSYLAYGPGWTPSYHMDTVTGDLTFFATLTGLADWKNVTLDLVSGSPNIVMRPQPAPEPHSFKLVAETADARGAPAYDEGFGPSTPLGDLHRYHYGRPVDMKRSETLRLPVLAGDVELLRHYYAIDAAPYASTVTPLERVELRNTLAEPLPPGIVRFYRDGTWIGEDTLASTPVGAHANVTLARSEDVQARVIADKSSTSGNVDSYSYRIVVENRKSGTAAEPIDTRITSRIPDYRTRLVSTEPQAETIEGSLLIWNDMIPAGGSATYRVSYETTRN